MHKYCLKLNGHLKIFNKIFIFLVNLYFLIFTKKGGSPRPQNINKLGHITCSSYHCPKPSKDHGPRIFFLLNAAHSDDYYRPTTNTLIFSVFLTNQDGPKSFSAKGKAFFQPKRFNLSLKHAQKVRQTVLRYHISVLSFQNGKHYLP